MTKVWHKKALELATTTDLSWRKIAKLIGEPKSSVSDYLREVFKTVPKQAVIIEKDVLKEEVIVPQNSYVTVKTNKTQGGKKYIIIPDTQCKPDIDMSYLEWIGKYIAEKKPDVIVHLGDHADMPSLSSYDKDKKSAEGKRVYKDIEASIQGMNKLLSPIKQEQDVNGYKPQMVFLLGNHCQRLVRHVEANPELDGFLSYDNLKYKEMGWDVYDFLEPVTLDGICFSHYFANNMTGKPLGGSTQNMLKTIGTSFIMGHRQCLDVAHRTLHNGKHQWGIVAGAAYTHNEDYKGYTGNKHWRGIVVLHNVEDGSFDPLFISMEYLQQRYGN